MAIVAMLSTFASGGAASQSASVRAEVTVFNAFASAAASYFDGRTAPANRSVYVWQDIRVAAPPGVMNVTMPDGWYVARGADGKWAACPVLRPEVVAAVGALFVPPEDESTPAPIALGPDFVGVGGYGMAKAADADVLCKGA
ncbi:hypothetical protein [Paracidovorax wautersii]|uniref:hypothetical protein n=1 Tax=Paracidovorax wautersii TaxID=1177982 RepID=UPI0011141087|nr:hypothetical protein [Paracidovorax wautersii]